MKTQNNQVSVIGRNFCLPHSTDLLITKNIWEIKGQGKFLVHNSKTGKLMFKIDASIFSFDRKRVMLDAAGTPIITLRKKVYIAKSKFNIILEDSKINVRTVLLISVSFHLARLLLRMQAFSVVTTWQVYRGEGRSEKDLIFSVRRSSIFQMKTKLAVFVAKKRFRLEDVCNYTVEGSWFQRSCQVYAQDSSTLLAQVCTS